MAEPLGSVHVIALPAKSLITTVMLPSWYVVRWLQFVVSPWSQTAVPPSSVKIPQELVLLQEKVRMRPPELLTETTYVVVGGFSVAEKAVTWKPGPSA